MDQNKAIVSDFLEFLEASTTAYHAVLECEKRLVKQGYVKLNMSEIWSIGSCGKYYIMPTDSMLVGVCVAPEMHQLNRFKVIAAHNDSPTFKVKTKSEMTYENCLKLNTEVYGGPILNTWLDRILALAGKVVLKSEDILQPNVRFVDLKNCLLTIPNIAIHMNRKINEGVALNPQVDLLPVLALIQDRLEAKGYLNNLLAQALNVEVTDILDFDLFLYLTEKGTLIGADEALISAPRLDDLAMVYASIQALMNSEASEGINIAVCFNHEEVGNTSIEGADSNVLATITQRLTMGYNKTTEQYHRMIDKSFMISADAAHAHHPNLPEKGDPTHQVLMNKGITIKNSAQKSYATDSESAAVFMQICEKAGVQVQRFANRSDSPGGKTLGPIANKYLPIRTVDVGVPMWAMHSAREVMGVQDFVDTIQVFETFYQC